MTYVSHEWTPDAPQAVPISKLQRPPAPRFFHTGDGEPSIGTSSDTSLAVGLAIALRHFGFHSGGPEFTVSASPYSAKGTNTRIPNADIRQNTDTVVA